MDVTGGNQRLIKLLGQFSHLKVNIYKVIIILNFRKILTPYHKCIISDRLDFQIIIKACYLKQLLMACPGYYSSDKLTSLTG